jgi:phenylacetate-CoA ligase
MVLTSLTKEAMPIIRYRTRDLTRLLPGTACSMRRIEKIRGRSDDMIILRGVNVFPSQIEEQLLAVPGIAPHFQIVLLRDRRLDHMIVHAKSAEVLEPVAQAALCAALAKQIRQSLGLKVEIILGAPGSVERSQGKALRVVASHPKA